MNIIYQNILKTALSSIDIKDKVNFVKLYWSAVDENILFNYAVKDEVASHVASILKVGDFSYNSCWDVEYEKVENTINVLMSVLDDVASVLRKHSIEIVALKNAGITRALYSNYACSPMGDLDLLVRVKDFRFAHKVILDELGFTFKFRSEFENEDIEEAFRGGGSEYFKFVDGIKVWLELQWRPIAGRWIQPHNEPDGLSLMNNSITVKHSAVRILAPEDNLLQVALHTAKHSYVRAPGFRLHSDVDRVVRFQKINWQKFEKKVCKLELRTAVYFSLFFSKELLETPIPIDILNKLKPIWYRGLIIKYFINKADIFDQKKPKFSKLGYIIFNLALYDTLSENFKAFFPPLDSLKIKYPIKTKWQLPYYYTLRFKDLLLKRAKL